VTAQVVGVVGNSKYVNVREEVEKLLYVPIGQSGGPFPDAALEVRYRGGAGQLERDIRQMVPSAAPGYHVSNVVTLEQVRDFRIAQERMLAFLSTLFGALGTCLALVGIYGLISYAVTRRTKEVGIRVAVGAQRSHVLRLFVGEAALLIAGGVMFGLPLALALARLVGSLLYEVSASEPADIATSVVLLAIGGLLAAYLPGRRATRIEPVEALRHE